MLSRINSAKVEIRRYFKNFCFKTFSSFLSKTSYKLISTQEKSELTARHDELTARHDELTARHDELTARNMVLGNYQISHSRNQLLQFLLSIDEFSFNNLVGTILRDSKSQLMQDVLAYFVSGNSETPGYFIEIGACDGVSFSNSYLLEKNFAWNGLAVEPARVWAESLVKNRNCKLDFRALARFSGESLLFSETLDPMYSTFSSLKAKDSLGELRLDATEYLVPAISLGDLLQEHSAPKEIDYLSIDTEGSDYDILRGLDFEKYFVKFITIEHNNTDDEKLIDELLLSTGFERVLAGFSLFDAWYINSKCSNGFTEHLKV